MPQKKVVLKAKIVKYIFVFTVPGRKQAFNICSASAICMEIYNAHVYTISSSNVCFFFTQLIKEIIANYESIVAALLYSETAVSRAGNEYKAPFTLSEFAEQNRYLVGSFTL